MATIAILNKPGLPVIRVTLPQIYEKALIITHEDDYFLRVDFAAGTRLDPKGDEVTYYWIDPLMVWSAKKKGA